MVMSTFERVIPRFCFSIIYTNILCYIYSHKSSSLSNKQMLRTAVIYQCMKITAQIVCKSSHHLQMHYSPPNCVLSTCIGYDNQFKVSSSWLVSDGVFLAKSNTSQKHPRTLEKLQIEINWNCIIISKLFFSVFVFIRHETIDSHNKRSESLHNIISKYKTDSDGIYWYIEISSFIVYNNRFTC